MARSVMRKLAYWALLGVASWAVLAGLAAGVALVAGWPVPPSAVPVAFAVLVLALDVAVSTASPHRHRR